MKSNMTTWQNAMARVEVLRIFAYNYCSRGVVILTLAFVGVSASLSTANTVHADTLYATGFENPPFTDGSLLVGQDGWVVGAIPGGELSPDAAVITNTVARSGLQSVEVRGADLIRSAPITDPYDAVGSYRRPLNYTVSPAKFTAIIEADLLLETNKPVTPGEFFSLTISARSGNGKTVGEIGLSSAGIVEAFDFNAAPGSAPVISQLISFNQWYHITMLLDYAGGRTSYLINGQFLGTVSTSGASKGLARASMVVYARPDGDPNTGPGSARSNYTARFDNFRVNVIGN